MGDRTRKSARQLWASLPDFYQQSAVAITDFWQAYTIVIPRKQHRAVGKESGQTNRIERLNNTNRAANFSIGKTKPIIFQKA